jgi:hypothetical protein
MLDTPKSSREWGEIDSFWSARERSSVEKDGLALRMIYEEKNGNLSHAVGFGIGLRH